MSLRTLAVAVLLMSALGCRATSPVAVMATEDLATTLSAEADVEAEARRVPRIVHAEAWIARDSLHIRARVHGVGPGWNAGAFLDTRNDDPDPRHSYRGWDYIAGFDEAQADGRFPIMLPPGGVDSGGGWGPIVGYGLIRISNRTLRTATPLSALIITEDRIRVGLTLFAGEVHDYVVLEAAYPGRRLATHVSR